MGKTTLYDFIIRARDNRILLCQVKNNYDLYMYLYYKYNYNVLVNYLNKVNFSNIFRKQKLKLLYRHNNDVILYLYIY